MDMPSDTSDDLPPNLPPDLPIQQQARVSLSLALRLHAEGRTDEANAVFNTLGQQVRRSGPVAVLIEGETTDADAAQSLEVLVDMVRACAEAPAKAGPDAIPDNRD